MHIAFLTPEYPHPKVKNAAGIGTTIMNLASALIQQGTNVSIFVYGQHADEVFVENGIKIHLIAKRKFRFATWLHYRKYLQNYINQQIKIDGIDLVEAPDWTGITAFMNLAVPIVIRFHGADAYFCHLENRRQKMTNFLFEKLGIRNATAYITPSDFTARITQQIFSIRDKSIVKIPSGLPLKKFQNDKPNEYESGLILYMGTIIRKKGVLELAPIFEHVLKKCPNANLIIVGSDSFDRKTKCESTWLLLQNALNGSTIARVKYLGKVPYEQVQDYIQKANVCVFPTFAETQGMVTIEAMAMKKSVVNSNMGWATEVIEDGVSGFLVNPKDHDAFANRIVEIIQNEKLNQSMGNFARARVEAEFDIDQLVKKNIEFYCAVLREKSIT